MTELTEEQRILLYQIAMGMVCRHGSSFVFTSTDEKLDPRRLAELDEAAHETYAFLWDGDGVLYLTDAGKALLT